MTIEAILQSIDSKLGVLISLNNAPAPAAPQQPASDPFIAGAGAEPSVAKQVSEAIAAAGGVSGTTEATPKRGRGRPAKTETTPVAAPTAAATPAVDPFAVGGEELIAIPVRTLNEVRAALIVFQAKNDQPKALKLVKDTAGIETLAQLKQEDYGKLFRAAIPADKFDLSDVRLVLVKANERVGGSGLDVLKRFGANTIVELTEDKFVDAIIAAHGVK